ncbi:MULTISPECIES: glycerophosphodiester phosphodiesterase family protein [unclassified Francisella]|uniref:glycerophosphodiester phosphodiesterase family protein n=1 Tax=unclassified Francisella TaxID=2610885 RepID=UPI002E3220FC|nr:MULTISPECIES: glycerophosphodiester phosphodiesterase family protein [unclassified Francisella]MED7819318.1 glycerophosphodiester phosphodiesterase family protein [Francisella sp. 19S2-4]MED7830142.1 glycerophosphodiester phosphodiesterase family protein [Francisella sp. 19S2-10]
MKIDKFISHRGNNIDFIENTIESFKDAKDHGFNWFETDVQISSDGELFLFHDKTPQRFAGCTRNVTEMTILELQALELTHPVTGVKSRILTLREYLDWVDKNNVCTNLELKVTNSCTNYSTNLVLATLRFLTKYPKLKDKILISSFSEIVMKALEQDKIYTKGKLFEVSDWDKDFEYLNNSVHKNFIKNNYIALIINYGCLNKDRVDYIKKMFGKVFVYSARTDEEVRNLLNWGVDAMFIDKKINGI